MTTSAFFSLQWTLYGAKEYLFVMDEYRQLDLSRDGAARECSRRAGDASLVTIDSEEELEFLATEIRRRVTAAGQELAHEQWWTAGTARAGRWVWDVLGYPRGTGRLCYKTRLTDSDIRQHCATNSVAGYLARFTTDVNCIGNEPRAPPGILVRGQSPPFPSIPFLFSPSSPFLFLLPLISLLPFPSFLPSPLCPPLSVAKRLP